MHTKVISAQAPNAISHAIDVLKHKGAIAFPTDTVYGLAALAFDAEAIESLYVIKGRQHTRSIAVLLGNLDQLEQISENPSPTVKKLAAAFWPGPLTLVMPRHPGMPAIISPDPTIGVRIPDHPVALELLNQIGPLAVTSANLSGNANARSAAGVMHQLGNRIHLILDGGQTPGGVPSTVVDATDDELKILRPGPIKDKELLAAL